ncbi:MAG TPA: hypothetical protein VGI85_05575 [Chthoniobacterales bacterium]|jgi:hypothetical protein
MPTASDFHNRSGAEEFVAAEIELAAALDPEQEKALRQSLEHLDAEAIDSCDIHAGRISISYDPTRTKREDLLRFIEQAGGKAKHVESESSPLLADND